MLQEKTAQKLQELMDEAVRRGETPGISLLMQDQQGQCYLQAGWSDLEEKAPMSRDRIFRLYSMTKPVTAVGAMILIEQGKLDLGEPVARYLPGFENQYAVIDGERVPVTNPMLVKDLLNMTSGLAYEGEATPAERETGRYLRQMQERLCSENPVTTLEAANHLGTLPLKFLPGTSWNYSMSADVLGGVIEAASGMRFGEFLKSYLFDPLGMEDTGFWVPESKRERLAKVYESDGKGGFCLYTENHLNIKNAMDCPPAFESGGAGLCSTIDDYMKFARMLLSGGTLDGVRVLQRRTVEFLCGGRLTPKQQEAFEDWRILNGYTYQHLMRFLVDESRAMSLGSAGEYGWDGWLGCYFSNDPAHQLTLLAMQQVKDAGFTPLMRRLRNLIFSQMD